MPLASVVSKRDRPRLRVPLPAKLFISYLLVVAVAAIPDYVYLRGEIEADLVEDARRQLEEAAKHGASALAALPPEDRLIRVAELARMVPDRVTFVARSGDVVFDSHVPEAARIANHRDRAEIAAALRDGVGSAARPSGTMHMETIYAAARIPSVTTDDADDGVVLRLARPLSEVRQATAGLTAFARNVQAVAISVAFGLSLLAAFKFVRPLQRVIAAAQALGAGDLAARSGVASNDEVGDAGRAIDTLALDVRRRLANAGSGDAVLAQLVDALALPCVVFETNGDVLALNGAARVEFRVEGPNASRRIKELTSTERVEAALRQAENDGEGEPVDIQVAPGHSVLAFVHVLKRPGAPPLIA